MQHCISCELTRPVRGLTPPQGLMHIHILDNCIDRSFLSENEGLEFFSDKGGWEGVGFYPRVVLYHVLYIKLITYKV